MKLLLYSEDNDNCFLDKSNSKEKKFFTWDFLGFKFEFLRSDFRHKLEKHRFIFQFVRKILKDKNISLTSHFLLYVFMQSCCLQQVFFIRNLRILCCCGRCCFLKKSQYPFWRIEGRGTGEGAVSRPRFQKSLFSRSNDNIT